MPFSKVTAIIVSLILSFGVLLMSYISSIEIKEPLIKQIFFMDFIIIYFSFGRLKENTKWKEVIAMVIGFFIGHFLFRYFFSDNFSFDDLFMTFLYEFIGLSVYYMVSKNQGDINVKIV